MVLCATASLSGAWYLSSQGVFGESQPLQPSIRTGSGGNSFSNSSVK